MAANLAAGSKAPLFKVSRDGGGHISSADFKGRKLVIGADARCIWRTGKHFRKINHNRFNLRELAPA
jgi:hypothetical protein